MDPQTHAITCTGARGRSFQFSKRAVAAPKMSQNRLLIGKKKKFGLVDVILKL